MDDLEQAILYYLQVLKERTRQAFPEDWATAQNSLADAYLQRIQGVRADNVEEAIVHRVQAPGRVRLFYKYEYLLIPV